MKKTIILLFILILSIILLGCEGNTLEEITIPETTITEHTESTKNEEPEYMVLSISPGEVFKIISSGKDYIILDVRTIEEYSEGHIECALLIPISELKKRLNEIDSNKTVIVYCKSGGRSRSAARILIENGFKEVYDMGGITDWISEGYPVTRGNCCD